MNFRKPNPDKFASEITYSHTPIVPGSIFVFPADPKNSNISRFSFTATFQECLSLFDKRPNFKNIKPDFKLRTKSEKIRRVVPESQVGILTKIPA